MVDRLLCEEETIGDLRVTEPLRDERRTPAHSAPAASAARHPGELRRPQPDLIELGVEAAQQSPRGQTVRFGGLSGATISPIRLKTLPA